MKKDFLTLADYKKEELTSIIEMAVQLKNKRDKGVFEKYLENKKAALLFENLLQGQDFLLKQVLLNWGVTLLF